MGTERIDPWLGSNRPHGFTTKPCSEGNLGSGFGVLISGNMWGWESAPLNLLEMGDRRVRCFRPPVSSPTLFPLSREGVSRRSGFRTRLGGGHGLGDPTKR